MVVVAETEWETWSRLVWSSGSPIPVNLTLVTSVTSNAPKAKNEKHQSVIKTWRVNITYQHCKEPWTQTHSEWRWGKGLWPRRPRAGGLHHPGLRHPGCLPKKLWHVFSHIFVRSLDHLAASLGPYLIPETWRVSSDLRTLYTRSSPRITDTLKTADSVARGLCSACCGVTCFA